MTEKQLIELKIVTGEESSLESECDVRYKYFKDNDAVLKFIEETAKSQQYRDRFDHPFDNFVSFVAGDSLQAYFSWE